MMRFFCWLCSGVVLFVVLGCQSQGPKPGDKQLLPWNAEKDLYPALMDFSPFAEVEKDKKLNEKFETYFRWLVELESPDAVFISKVMKQPTKALHLWGLIYHEKVEFREWLKLGHKLKDMLVIEYNQKHYPSVYPIVHGRAMEAEMALLRYFARKMGYPKISEKALLLVHPMIGTEMKGRKLTPKLWIRRARYNPEFLKAPVTKTDLESAIKVFEMGGHSYPDRNKTLAAAQKY